MDPLVLTLPVLAACLLVGGACVLFRRGTGPRRAGWEALGLAGGAIAAHLLLRGWRGFPPGDLNDWPLWVAAASLLVGLATPWRWWLRGALGLLTVAAAAPLLLRRADGSWTVDDPGLAIPVAIAGWFALVLAAPATATRLPVPALAAWAATAAATAGAVVLGHAATIGLTLGGLGLGAAVFTLLAWRWPERIATNGPAAVLALLVPAWLILAATLADLPRSALGLLAIAPLTAWLAWPLRGKPLAAAITAALAAGAVGGAACWLSYAANPSQAPGW
jgi:hypothetical protein